MNKKILYIKIIKLNQFIIKFKNKIINKFKYNKN